LPLRLVAGGQLIEQLRVHFHKRLQHVVDERHNGLIPVLLADAIKGREHDGHDDRIVLLDERHGVLIVPQIKSSLSNLKEGD